MPELFMVPPGNALSCMHKNDIILKNPTSGLLHNLTNNVTVEFWSFGRDDIQAYTSNNEIIRAETPSTTDHLLSVCLPQMNASNPSSAKIIFRTSVASIEKEVSQQDYHGRWNHWAFVQNGAAQSMTMYLNGNYLFHQDNLAMNLRGNEMAKFRIAYGYVGYLEELRIWKSARTEQEIRDNMNNFNISPTHRDLIIYCKFDRIDYTFIKNFATNAIHYDVNPGFNVAQNQDYYIEGYIPTNPSLLQIKPIGSYAYYDQNNKLLENDTNSAVTRLRTDSQLNLISEVAMIIEHDFAGSRSSGFLENIGNPSYDTGKHWMNKDERISDITIDTIVPHDFRIDTRYVLDSYTIVNASGATGVPLSHLPDIANPTYTLSAQTLSGWIKVIFKWKTQHSVEVRAVPPLPNSGRDLISLTVQSNPGPTTPSNKRGIGIWWYDKGTVLVSTAINPSNYSCPLLCKGYFDNSDPTKPTVNPATTKQIPNSNSGLTQGDLLIWKYEPPIYQEQVTIGNPLSLRNMTQEHRSMIDFTREPVQPSIQNNEKLFYWDNTEKKVYPLIGGNRSFKIEWYFQPNMNCSSKIVSEISTTWPTSMTQTQYDHIANTPPVILDPDPNDDISFNSLLYTEGDGSVSENKEFSAIQNGKSVLLFDKIKPEIKDINIHGGLLAYYNFDQTAGTVLPDISGNNNDGTLSTAMQDNDWVSSTSFLNNALNFADDLNGKYVSLSNFNQFSSINEDITIDFWTDDLSLSFDTQNIIIDTFNTQNNAGFKIEFLGSNTVQFIIGSQQPVTANISGSEFKYGWNYWVFTQNSTTHKINIYLNGYSLLLNNNPGNGDMITNLNSGQTYSGQNPIKGDQISQVRIGEGFPGKIDELRIWNIARSHTAILEYYNDGYSPLRIVETNQRNNKNIDNTATVGKEITSSFHDNRTPHNGYIYWVNSPYNANIYDRNTMQGEIFPVNVYQPYNRPGQQDLYSQDKIEVVWYEVKDEIAWPYQPMKYTVSWPDYPTTEANRIVIASQLGSEGKDKNGNDQKFPDINGITQNYLDPARYQNITIYNQPDRTKPGYNPNEEHAIIAPSFRHAKAAPKPFAAFALRNDLNTFNETASSSKSYTTSEPFVLVQYLDQLTGKHGMATFKVEKNDPAYGYDFSYHMEAGKPIFPPYPLNLVIGATPPSENFRPVPSKSLIMPPI